MPRSAEEVSASKKRRVVILASLTAAIAVAVAGWVGVKQTTQSAPGAPQPSTGQSSASSPPTAASSSVPDSSAANVSGQPANPSTPGGPQVHIVTATADHKTGAVSVSATVSGAGIMQGSCTLIASSGTDVVKGTGPATFDGRNLSCGSLVATVSPGVWSIKVVFMSTNGTSESANLDVTV